MDGSGDGLAGGFSMVTLCSAYSGFRNTEAGCLVDPRPHWSLPKCHSMGPPLLTNTRLLPNAVPLNEYNSQHNSQHNIALDEGAKCSRPSPLPKNLLFTFDLFTITANEPTKPYHLRFFTLYQANIAHWLPCVLTQRHIRVNGCWVN